VNISVSFSTNYRQLETVYFLGHGVEYSDEPPYQSEFYITACALIA